MHLISDLSAFHLDGESILTIGAFDGVHIGHQHLICQVTARAAEMRLASALVTFHPHPMAIIAPQVPVHYLTTPGQRVALFERLGLDVVAILQFNRALMDTSASDFARILSEHLHMRELWVGADFAMGRDRQGDLNALRALGTELGYALHVVEPFLLDGAPISSTRIRKALDAGDMREVRRLLGRYVSLSGEVVQGAHRGRALGFPTANLDVRAEHTLPADGVYAVFAWLGAERYMGAASVGVRPTFDNGRRTVETYILDFDQDIYGCDLMVEFVERLRPEARFESVNALIGQMRDDVEHVREILSAEAAETQTGEEAVACLRKSSTLQT